jgi:predicted Fe-S protein YdhL (DUF1289 family)
MQEIKKITSPCIGLCGLVDGKCGGCKRTLEEIRGWRNYTEKQRKEIIKQLKTR